MSHEQDGQRQEMSSYKDHYRNPYNQGPNSSQFYDQSSIVTPNLSNGGKKLLNQLDQVLMMKSGEFSAGGRRDDLVNSAGSAGFEHPPIEGPLQEG